MEESSSFKLLSQVVVRHFTSIGNHGDVTSHHLVTVLIVDVACYLLKRYSWFFAIRTRQSKDGVDE